MTVVDDEVVVLLVADAGVLVGVPTLLLLLWGLRLRM